MKISETPLRRSTFWDVPFGSLNLRKDMGFIIRRVFQKGRDEEIRFVRKHFTKMNIVSSLQTCRDLDPKIISFVSLVYGANKSSFKGWDARSRK